MAPMTASGTEAVRRALDFLRREQRPSGEFPSVAGALDGDDPVWEDDTLTFITALVVLALVRLPRDEVVDEMVGRAIGFLESEREPGAVWRYWSRGHPRHGFTPPDADDTACVSMALNGAGIDTTANHAVLRANRDSSGRFYTWIVPHRPWSADPRAWRVLRREVGASRRRHELWESTEATHGDVDGVVNANVVRYLGTRAPVEAVEFVVGLVENDREPGCDSWHHSPFALYASVGDGYRRGVERFSSLGARIEAKISTAASVEATTRADGWAGSSLDAAHALQALGDLGRDGPAARASARRLVSSLTATQMPDGSWPRSVCYFGGPQAVFGWASDALTAASAAAAVHSAIERGL